MRYPKHKADLFLVERFTAGKPAHVICGAFSSLEGAQTFLDACVQDLVDRGFKKELDEGLVGFKTAMTTYYDD